MASSKASSNGTSASLKKCITCGEDKPITKFKTNNYDKDGNRTRMATCRDCTEAKKTSGVPKPSKPGTADTLPPRDECSSEDTPTPSNSSSIPSSHSSDMVMMKKLQAIECAINAIKEM